MEGYGLLILIAILVFIIAIFMNTCSQKEGFVSFQIPKAGPDPTRLPTQKEPTGYTSIADLPSAPINGLAETNSLPYQNPELEKSSFSQLKSLKEDMDGFAANELPHLEQKSDPAVQLPATRFKGDYQRVKDELHVISRTPSLQPQLTINDINDMAANLRFLQRTYRLYANTQMVPSTNTPLTKVGITEGFVTTTSGTVSIPKTTAEKTTPITPDEVSTLSQKLAVEIARLQASGTNDPVLQARVNIFSKIRQSVDDINTKLKNKTMAAKDIPIMKSDYNNFLPALGNTSAGIGGLLSKSGNESISSLFNSYDKGDIEGSELSAALFEKYAEDLIKGTSLTVSYKYTGKNEVEKEKAIAQQAKFAYDMTTSMQEGGLLHPSSQGDGLLHPGTQGARGEFDSIIRSLDISNFQNNESQSSGIRPLPVSPTAIGSFDWKERAEAITQNIKKAGLNPADYGCLAPGAQVSPDYSWRGHTKMICTRLASNVDSGVPEQMGCPPVSWKGWRL
jgi:hypothetical protein